MTDCLMTDRPPVADRSASPRGEGDLHPLLRPTDRPTATADRVCYYSYRVTTEHDDLSKVQEIIERYTKLYLIALHSPDDTEKSCLHQHLHCVFPGVDADFADRFKKAMSKEFDRKGNAFHAGCYRNGPLEHAITYFKHDDNVEFIYSGDLDWEDMIELAPAYSKKAPEVKEKRERQSDPVLTYSNLLFQALKHRRLNKIKSAHLSVTLEHMTRTTDWLPTRQMLSGGLDPLHHRLFEYRANGRIGPTPDWWTPRTI